MTMLIMSPLPYRRSALSGSPGWTDQSFGTSVTVAVTAVARSVSTPRDRAAMLEDGEGGRDGRHRR